MSKWSHSVYQYSHWSAVCSRCIAVCSLGLWVCEELMQQNIHHQVEDAINVLGVTLKVSAFYASAPVSDNMLCGVTETYYF